MPSTLTTALCANIMYFALFRAYITNINNIWLVTVGKWKIFLS